jgi:N utilization substance protein B
MSRVPESRRRKAREVAFRLAYQADLAGESARDAWQRTRDEEPLTEDQLGLVEDVVRTLSTLADEVDRLLSEAAEHWQLGRLAATDRAVLRGAVAELLARPGVPARVVLDEAITLAGRYGSADSGRFVNGVLDRVARRLRPEELS